jgi:hypothetical protein
MEVLMATATATFTLDKTATDVSMRCVTYKGTVAIQAGPATYATGGLTLNLAVAGVLQKEKPIDWDIKPNTGNWMPKYVPGTNITDGKIVILGVEPTDATAGIVPFPEFSNATAVPATMSGSSFPFSFKVRKGR